MNAIASTPMDAAAKNAPSSGRLFFLIGLALDLKGGRMFITDFGGSVYSANLDGSIPEDVAGC